MNIINNYNKSNKLNINNVKSNIINNFAKNINSEFNNKIINNKKNKMFRYLNNIIAVICYNKIFNYKEKCKFILQLFAINPKFKNKGYRYKVFNLFKHFICLKK